LFADQLGPHYLDFPHQPVLLLEARAVFRRRRFHRQKAHLLLSGLRHRARELGEQAVYLQVDSYREGLAQLGEDVTATQPTSFAAARFAREHPSVELLPDVGYRTDPDEFGRWATGRRRLLMEDFYRDQRRRYGVLMDGDEPAGGQWNLDHDNREPPPKRQATLGLPAPWRATEDDIDAEVREDLDRWQRDGLVEFTGDDGPRWAAVTRDEALAALARFVDLRLATFGPPEDAMMAEDWAMSHSQLSPVLNLGLLHPLEPVRAAEAAYRAGRAPLNSVEGFIRQVLGWREYVWATYWHFGPSYRSRNALEAKEPVPEWMWDLDADGQVRARCLSTVLAQLRTTGWVHHIPRLMVLGNYMMQRGWDPAQVVAWFHQSFVDGYDWVMLPNALGMSQWADGGRMMTKPYAGGGAYINRMSDFCGPCEYDPKVRVGPQACPFTAGYWAFLDRNEDKFRSHPRMGQVMRNMDRLTDLDQLREQERARGSSPP